LNGLPEWQLQSIVPVRRTYFLDPGRNSRKQRVVIQSMVLSFFRRSAITQVRVASSDECWLSASVKEKAMLRKLLNGIGYRSIDDAMDFLMCGLGTLPSLLMLSGFMVAGAVSLITMLLLVAAVGMHTPPPAPPADATIDKPDKERRP